MFYKYSVLGPAPRYADIIALCCVWPGHQGLIKLLNESNKMKVWKPLPWKVFLLIPMYSQNKTKIRVQVEHPKP